MAHSPEKIKLAIKDIPLLTNSQLEHNLKCASSQKTPTLKKLYTSFIIAVEKERRKRGVRTISTKPTAVRDTSNLHNNDAEDLGAKASDYD